MSNGDSRPSTGVLRIKVEGLDVEPGTIPFRDIRKLADLTQSGVERAARALSGDRTKSAGLREIIREASELVLVRLEAGSTTAVAELRAPADTPEQDALLPLPPTDLGFRAAELFVGGLAEIGASTAPAVPRGWDNPMMEIAEALAEFTHERAISISLNTEVPKREPVSASISPEHAEKFTARHVSERRTRTVRGELILIDVDTGRIDVKDVTGRRTHCTFLPNLRDQVVPLIGHTVVVAGEEEVDTATGKTRALEVTNLAEAGEQFSFDTEFWENVTSAELTRRQGVAAIRSVAELGASELFDEGEIAALLDAVAEGRSSQN